MYEANRELVNTSASVQKTTLDDLVGVGVEDRSGEPMFCGSGEDGVTMQGVNLGLGTENDDLYTGDI